MDQPLARLAGRPDHVVPLPRADADRVLLVPGGRRKRVPVGRHHGERSAVDVHRVDEVVVAADEADEQLLADLAVRKNENAGAVVTSLNRLVFVEIDLEVSVFDAFRASCERCELTYMSRAVGSEALKKSSLCSTPPMARFTSHCDAS